MQDYTNVPNKLHVFMIKLRINPNYENFLFPYFPPLKKRTILNDNIFIFFSSTKIGLTLRNNIINLLLWV